MTEGEAVAILVARIFEPKDDATKLRQAAAAHMYPNPDQPPDPPALAELDDRAAFDALQSVCHIESTQDALAKLAKAGVVLAKRVAVVVLAVWLVGCGGEPAWHPPCIVTEGGDIGQYVESATSVPDGVTCMDVALPMASTSTGYAPAATDWRPGCELLCCGANSCSYATPSPSPQPTPTWDAVSSTGSSLLWSVTIDQCYALSFTDSWRSWLNTKPEHCAKFTPWTVGGRAVVAARLVTEDGDVIRWHVGEVAP